MGILDRLFGISAAHAAMPRRAQPLEELMGKLPQRPLPGGPWSGVDPTPRDFETLPLPELKQLGIGVDGQPLPEWLPDAVRRIILGQRSYPEGQLPPLSNPALEWERRAHQGVERPIPLVEDLGYGSYQQNGQWILEGNRVLPSPGQLPYASPRHQTRPPGRRSPWALY
jgi:hypothetical protein